MPEPRSAADRIALTGAVTIREIEGVRSDLLARLGTQKALEVDCSGVTEADISLVQLLIAASRSGADLRLAQPYPEAVQQVLARSGLDAAATLWRENKSPGEN